MLFFLPSSHHGKLLHTISCQPVQFVNQSNRFLTIYFLQLHRWADKLAQRSAQCINLCGVFSFEYHVLYTFPTNTFTNFILTLQRRYGNRCAKSRSEYMDGLYLVNWAIPGWGILCCMIADYPLREFRIWLISTYHVKFWFNHVPLFPLPLHLVLMRCVCRIHKHEYIRRLHKLCCDVIADVIKADENPRMRFDTWKEYDQSDILDELPIISLGNICFFVACTKWQRYGDWDL